MLKTLSTLFIILAGSMALQATSEPAASAPAEPCAGGVILDDGQVDSGYSFVPSATEGIYVQYFDSELFERRDLESVCVCWLKTRQDRKDVAFEVVFFAKDGKRPEKQPYAWIEAVADEVPDSVAAAGEFVEVDVRGVSLPEDGGFVGVRWNPSEEAYLFLCNDRTESTEPTVVGFRDDRSSGWTEVTMARDPIFKPHRAVMVRVKPLAENAETPPPWEPPALEIPEKDSTLTAQPSASSPPRVQPADG